MSRSLAVALAVVCLASLTFVPVHADPSAAGDPAYRTLLPKADLLVTTRFVLHVKMEGAPADQEIESDTSCLMIDASGLLLCSNVELGGYISLVSRMTGNQGLSGSPTDLEVSIGGTDYPAQLVARDTDRDLAWVRLQKAEGKTFAHLDLTASAKLGPGDAFYGVRRLHEFFARAPLVTRGTVGAVLTRPRELLVPASGLGGGFGVAVFDAAGAFVGMTVLQMPGEDDAAQNLFNSPLSFLGQSSRLQDMMGGMILPAAEIVKATQLARETFPAEAAPAGE